MAEPTSLHEPDSVFFLFMRLAPLFILIGLVIFILLILSSMKKTPSELWRNFAPNLKVFYLYMAAFVGLVLTVVNGVTLTQTYLETEVFGVEYSYLDYWTCENKYDTEGDPVEMTEEENAACMDRVTDRAVEQYAMESKRAYASGIAGLLFGVIVWIPHFVLARRA